MLDGLSCLATAALQQRDICSFFGIGGLRESDAPEIVGGVQKRDAVSIDAGFHTDLADDAHFRFFIGIQAAKN